MNNSRITIETSPFSEESQPDRTAHFREMEIELIAVIEAIQKVQDSVEWSTLKTKIFEKLPESLVKELLSESRKETPNINRLNHLAGELKWAERFADLSTFEASKRLELTQVRKQLYGTTQENS